MTHGEAISAGRASIPGNNRFVADQILAIRKRIESGEQGKKIAADYGVHPAYITLIKQRKVWKHLGEN